MIITKSDLKSGDIILCYSSSARDKGEQGLESGYVHAAIYLESNKVAEATGRRVKESNLDNLVDEYDHISVLRQPDAWHESNVLKLKDFIRRCISTGAKFNTQGIRDFKRKDSDNLLSDLKRLRKYFDGDLKTKSSVREKYFCSELVVSAYIYVGFITESAAVVYRPEDISPDFLGKDPTFGTYVGYIKPYDDYEIPAGDMFENSTPFHEIFEGSL